MPKIEIRYQKVRDAKRFFEIFNNSNFEFLSVIVKSLADEQKFLRGNHKKRKNNLEHNYAILYGTKVVGAIGVRIINYRNYIGEIGYFIDEKYWGQGIATKALKLIERGYLKKLHISRMQLVIDPRNLASIKVAEKCGYKKEGLMKKAIKLNNKKVDAYLYAKAK
jgi:ribosomal-protein-alanine N-acetyltransferase